ncbi:hypothetical protein DFH06DRAFT_1133760 [Mycena polygramma]|nr:hypothetical protein DFH06DRAFT_1133760 [Mycena polygramma]
MPRAWLGLKARAWAWLGRALAWESSGPSPSPPAGLGLAWLGPRPGLAYRNLFRMLGTVEYVGRTTHPEAFLGFGYSGQSLRAWLGLQFFKPWALGPAKPDGGLGLARA